MQNHFQEEQYDKKDDIFHEFTFDDFQGNLKLAFKWPFKNGSVCLSFQSIVEFYQMINKVTTWSSHPYEDEIKDVDEEGERLELIVIVISQQGSIGDFSFGSISAA